MIGICVPNRSNSCSTPSVLRSNQASQKLDGAVTLDTTRFPVKSRHRIYNRNLNELPSDTGAGDVPKLEV